jgi:hypothetical protein
MVPREWQEGIDVDTEFAEVVVDYQPPVRCDPVDELLASADGAAQPAQNARVDQAYYCDQRGFRGVEIFGEAWEVACSRRGKFGGEVTALGGALGTALVAAADQESIYILVPIRPDDLGSDRRTDHIEWDTKRVQPGPNFGSQFLIRAARHCEIQVVLAGKVAVDVGTGQPGTFCDLAGQGAGTVLLDYGPSGVEYLFVSGKRWGISVGPWRCRCH